MSKGVLVDLTRCIGCGSCSVACKLYNKNEWIEDRAPTSGKAAKLADENWTIVKQHNIPKSDYTALRFVKRQCFHCQEPACVSACFASAFKKTEEGAVVYHPSLCVGCRYCMVACPFDIPKYEWGKVFPVVTKCMMCFSRIIHGELPACTAVCPTNVMEYGDRDELLIKAKDRINSNLMYVKHIYGEKEAGGTGWLYLSDVPFEQLGFKTGISEKPANTYTSKYMALTPVLGVAWGLVLTGLYLFNKRRKKNTDEKAKLNQKGDNNA
jgi:formate dehydrogenase iron-sulfur subunit